jgi:hypothetical protein
MKRPVDKCLLRAATFKFFVEEVKKRSTATFL